MSKRTEILKKLKNSLDAERFEHSLRVEKIAIKLARNYGVPVKNASLAALLHDCARKYRRAELLKQARELKLKIDPVQELEPKLLHAELSARIAEKEFGIRSPEILKAIRRHTTGVPRMNLLEKIIYLADHLEEGRDFAGIKKVRAAAFCDLDQAIVESSSKTIKYLIKKGLPIYPGTVRTRNYYLIKA